MDFDPRDPKKTRADVLEGREREKAEKKARVQGCQAGVVACKEEALAQVDEADGVKVDPKKIRETLRQCLVEKALGKLTADAASLPGTTNNAAPGQSGPATEYNPRAKPKPKGMTRDKSTPDLHAGKSSAAGTSSTLKAGGTLAAGKKAKAKAKGPLGSPRGNGPSGHDTRYRRSS
ncbi:unnamed protein product [Amoebophrya sp. A25]|nr:unnamed protein product [Amoebophrya sp. A25]|eukprot:GSA25T00019112001.1